MAKYALPGNQGTLTTTYKTAFAMAAQAAASGIRLQRAGLYDLTFGPSGPPNATDCSIQYDLSLTTVVGTSTAFTPNYLDSGDSAVAASTLCGVNHTVEPTVTANSSRFNKGVNQRQDGRWVPLQPDQYL